MASLDAQPDLHPAVAALAFLLGTWVGEGRGEYPTIEPFEYREEARFWHAGKPWLAYGQRTWSLDDGRPLHAETGYWRPQPDGGIEAVMAHPTGLVEVQQGTVDGNVLEVTSTLVGRTSSAKDVAAVTRRLEASGDVLTYRVSMAAVGQPLQHHLSAELHRV